MQLLNMNNYKPINLSKAELESLERGYKVFLNNKGDFRIISTYKDKIFFELDKDDFAIVYTLEGSKPTKMDILDSNDYHFYVKELKPNWYQVTGTHQ